MKRCYFILALIVCLLILPCEFSFASDVEKDRAISAIGTLVNRGKYKTALKQCNEAIAKYPQNLHLYYWRAVIYSSLGDNKSALNDYNKSIELDAENSNTYVMRGICKYELMDYEGALADYNKAIELNPENSSAYNMRAALKLHIGDMDGAQEDFEHFDKK